MKKSFGLLFACLLCIIASVNGKSTDIIKSSVKNENNAIVLSGIKNPVTQSQFFAADSLKKVAKDTIRHKKHRLIAALLSFPVLGIFGLHRIYLGTSVQVPFVYIVTAGGGFGVLPFIDFVMILLSKNKDFHSTYTGNHHLFMWQKTHK